MFCSKSIIFHHDNFNEVFQSLSLSLKHYHAIFDQKSSIDRSTNQQASIIAIFLRECLCFTWDWD